MILKFTIILIPFECEFKLIFKFELQLKKLGIKSKVVAEDAENASDLEEILYRESCMSIMKSGTRILFLAQIFFSIIILNMENIEVFFKYFNKYNCEI